VGWGGLAARGGGPGGGGGGGGGAARGNRAWGQGAARKSVFSRSRSRTLVSSAEKERR
jgi:hypothetical protein